MGSEFQICGAEILKPRDASDKLCRGITSWWELDEHNTDNTERVQLGMVDD